MARARIERRLCSVYSPRAVSTSIRFRRRGHRCPVFHSVGTSAPKNARRIAGTSCQYRVARRQTISICLGLRRSSVRRDDSNEEEVAAADRRALEAETSKCAFYIVAGPRGGAAMTAACLKLLHEANCPIWPWQRSARRLLAEAFPAAQLRHWQLPHQA